MKFHAFIQARQRELARRKKLLKKKVLILKVKFFFLAVLPFVITILAARILQTLLQARLRSAASSVSLADSGDDRAGGPATKPVSQTFFKPEFVKPAPVSQRRIKTCRQSDGTCR